MGLTSKVSWYWSVLWTEEGGIAPRFCFVTRRYLACHSWAERKRETQYCWQRHPTTANLHVTCCVVGDGCSRVLLHRHSQRFTSALCNSAEMFQGAPGGGEMEGRGGMERGGGLGHMHGGSSLGLRACERARFMSACIRPATGICCFYLLARQLLTLWFGCLMRGSHKASRFN